MSVVGDVELKKLGIAGEKDQINSASIDLAISNKIILVDFQGYISKLADIETKNPYEQMFVDALYWEAKIRHTHVDLNQFPAGIWIRPGVGILASTASKVKIPKDRVGQVLLKSSRARDFVQSCMAGFHDNGFEGHTTLELYPPVVPIKIIPDMKIVQLRVDDLSGFSFDYSTQHDQKYMNQEGPTPSRDGSV